MVPATRMAQLHQCAIFRQNWSILCGNVVIFRIFKMPDVAILGWEGHCASLYLRFSHCEVVTDYVTVININYKNCSLSTVLTATQQELQKS